LSPVSTPPSSCSHGRRCEPAGSHQDQAAARRRSPPSFPSPSAPGHRPAPSTLAVSSLRSELRHAAAPWSFAAPAGRAATTGVVPSSKSSSPRPSGLLHRCAEVAPEPVVYPLSSLSKALPRRHNGLASVTRLLVGHRARARSHRSSSCRGRRRSTAIPRRSRATLQPARSPSRERVPAAWAPRGCGPPSSVGPRGLESFSIF
jgi:hypothetical protein